MPELTDKSEKQPSIKDLTSTAMEAETAKDTSSAIDLYNAILKINPLQSYPYERLMKIYRKGKDFKKELSTIDSGIKVFEKFYKEHPSKTSGKIREISEKLNKAFHLVDKKGNSLYNPEPIGTWQKRKQTVEKKLEKESKKKK